MLVSSSKLELHLSLSAVVVDEANVIQLWTGIAKTKLNPLRAKWPIEPALISDFRSVKRMRVFDSPGQDTNPSQVSSQQTLVLIYLPQKDGKLR